MWSQPSPGRRRPSKRHLGWNGASWTSKHARATDSRIHQPYISQSQIHVIPAIFCHQHSRTVSVVIGCDSISLLLRRFALGKATQVSCGPIPHDPWSLWFKSLSFHPGSGPKSRTPEAVVGRVQAGWRWQDFGDVDITTPGGTRNTHGRLPLQ
jgi:hypothetical protein